VNLVKATQDFLLCLRSNPNSEKMDYLIFPVIEAIGVPCRMLSPVPFVEKPVMGSVIFAESFFFIILKTLRH